MPTLLSVGCEFSRSEVSDSKQSDDRAKADFDWAMERLRRAIETFTPSGNLGLSIKRELSYEFIPPNSPQSNCTARVIVDSKTAYRPKRFYPAADEELSVDPKAVDNAFTEEELQAKRANDPTGLQDDFVVGLPPKAPIVDPLVNAPSREERIVYELVYRDKRWQLETQPESEHERLWFEYALQQ
ncbi:MAG: hypothetical protein GXP28_05405 [Planctomycetes bacterium]|nr:hypothetical protein [Planctomycetota bacterium]